MIGVLESQKLRVDDLVSSFGLEFGGVKWRRSRRNVSGAAQPQWNAAKLQTEVAADAVNSMPFVTSAFFAKWSGPGRDGQGADEKTVK